MDREHEQEAKDLIPILAALLENYTDPARTGLSKRTPTIAQLLDRAKRWNESVVSDE